MERFTDKKMTESQITEIVDLFNGEHAEALQLWTERTNNNGAAAGMISGALWTLVGAGLVKLTWNMAKTTLNWGKGLVLYVKDNYQK